MNELLKNRDNMMHKLLNDVEITPETPGITPRPDTIRISNNVSCSFMPLTEIIEDDIRTSSYSIAEEFHEENGLRRPVMDDVVIRDTGTLSDMSIA